MTSNFAQRIQRGKIKTLHTKLRRTQNSLQFTPECICDLNVQHCIHRTTKQITISETNMLSILHCNN